MKFKTLILELTEKGISQAEIAREIGISAPSVNAQLHSDRPKDMYYQNGIALVKMHKRIMRNSMKQAA